jgi:predicted SprT family Zn-dependent metalloprotease
MESIEVSEVISEVYRLLNQHGLVAQGWGFKLGRGKRRLGCCRYRDKTISISKYHIALNTREEVMDTVRHEVAHAIAGPGTGHGSKWKRIAASIGAKPSRTAMLTESAPHSYEIVCGLCHKVLQKRYRKMNPARLKRSYHPQCGRESIGKLSLERVMNVRV